MTAPLDPRLPAIAAWDVPALAGAVRLLDDVVEALPFWRYRLEAVGRALEGAEVWSGTAARVAATVVLGLSAASTAVTAALERSLEACRRLVREAGTAAGTAQTALGRPATDPAASALADAALVAAARAAAAADDARAALAVLGVRDAAAPGSIADLTSRTRSLPLPDPPGHGTPHERAQWWVALSAPTQRALIRTRPEVLGALDGIPAWARDRANRIVLARALAAPRPSATARAVAAEIDDRERGGTAVQLHLFDEPGQRVALALGDVDTAGSIVLLVPGVATTPDDDLDAVTADVDRVLDAAAELPAAGELAGVAWLGYRPPRGPAVLLRSAADRGGPALDGALDGQRAARSAVGLGSARTTVLAHSYGTVVVDAAADASGRLAADALVLLGSPGMQPDRTPLAEVAEVHAASSSADPVTWPSWFGVHPTRGGSYGASVLPVDPGTGHSDYLDRGGATLAAVADVVVGPSPPG